jgi:hypothetical protein
MASARPARSRRCLPNFRTAGADKVGFASRGRDASGKPIYQDGVRGAIERNADALLLAIDSYLVHRGAGGQAHQPTGFAATERYPQPACTRMDRSTYVSMKRSEYERQQTAALN